MTPCAALDWKRVESGKDYVECAVEPTDRVRIEGLLLSAEYDLCRPHQDYFERHEGWKVTRLGD